MGMDNRKGAFWMQLRDHYKSNGYAPPSDGGEGEFDPAQFSLCYDRQPLSMDLRSGVGSGALTLGGTDPLLHNTDMVYASNVTPIGGWYAVRVKAMFLRTNGGTLLDPPSSTSEGGADGVRYIRVNAKEGVLNGSDSPKRGVILDSGTTDTYLPIQIRRPFQAAWQEALGSDKHYDNNPRVMTAEEVKSLPTIMLVLQGHGPSNGKNKDAVGMASSHGAMFVDNANMSTDPKQGGGDNGGAGLESVSKSDVVVAIPPGHYMEESHREPGKYTARVYFTERFGAQSILGSNVLMGHEVLFDNGRGRVGFAESHCDYGRYVEERDARRRQQQQMVEGDEAVQHGANGDAVVDAEGQDPAKNDLAASGWARSR